MNCWLQVLVVFLGVGVVMLSFALGYGYRMWREIREFDDFANELRFEFLESLFDPENPNPVYYGDWEFYRRDDGVVEVRRSGASKEQKES